jgi:DnaJ-class molecular chaperone
MIIKANPGFVPLPAPAKPWWIVLGLPEDAGKEKIIGAYKTLAAERHPDRGGSHTAMAELNAARDAAMKELGT